jgi:hypothetical protein
VIVFATYKNLEGLFPTRLRLIIFTQKVLLFLYGASAL